LIYKYNRRAENRLEGTVYIHVQVTTTH
jgi:hypothetical protein